MVMGSIATGTEVLVIGGGPGGYVAAHRAAQLGKDVTLVEMAGLGGVCLQQGCIPSKALISSGELISRLEEAAERGITAEKVSLDGARLQAWKRKVIDRLEKGVAGLLKSADVSVVKGKATFTDAKTVAVTPVDGEGPTQAFTFEQCIIATGSAPINLKFMPFDGQRVLDARDVLALTEIPASVAVVGGGYIGIELGLMLRKLGAKVTVVEALDNILTGVDPDLVNVLSRRLRRLGVEVHTGASARGVAEEGLTVAAAGGATRVIPADKILVSVGRRPLTGEIGIEHTGIQLDGKGFIPVDQQCRTAVPHIYAIGDVTAGPMLAHRASKQAIVAAEAIAGLPSATDWVSVPAVVYTDPEIAYVGLSEAQAKEAGYEVDVAKFFFQALGRALTLGQSDGLIKIVAEKGSGVVLGVHMIGPEVSELISEATLALEMGATVEDLAATIHPHPTLAEGLMEAAQQLLHKAH